MIQSTLLQETLCMAKSLFRYQQGKEKKRYECAKDILCAMIANPQIGCEADVKEAIRMTDVLIEELTKT